ncbi:phage tail protein, partial [Salmonella enterica]|nr:phage tail protein [Salmonella enterica]
MSIGNIGTGVFDGSTPCINIGDSDSGFIGS